jgi:uncharacterized protein
MLRYIVCVITFGLLQSSVLADPLTPSKRSDIKTLIETTGGTKIASQFAVMVTRQMFSTLKAARPEIPDRALGVMEQELTALFNEKVGTPGGLIDSVIPVYDKYFSHAEVKELLAFYQTSIGKKAIAVLPQVVGESMVAGRRWGESLGPEIERRIDAALKREGLLPVRK